jgi:hypothetical protein
VPLHRITPSEQVIEKQFLFDGEWIPDHDPTKIGENNFSELTNLRYVDQGIGPIEGYTKLTTNIIDATYKYPEAGIQLRTPFTTASYIIVHAWNLAETASEIHYNTTAVPNAGDFTGTALFVPSTDGAAPRFSHLPRGIGFCNEEQSVVFEGCDTYAGSVILCDAAAALLPTNGRDFSSEMSNRYTTASEQMAVPATARVILIGTTRPIQRIYFDVGTANPTDPTTTDVKEWSSAAWTATTSQVDGTVTGGTLSMGQSGWFTFDSTVTTAEPVFIDGNYLYFYKVTMSDGTVTLNRILVDMPMQESVDIWDGVYRTCIGMFTIVNQVGPSDYTLEVNEPSNIDYPIAARVGQFRNHASDTIEMCFEERMSAIDFRVISEAGNQSGSVTTMKYWDGDSWVAVSGLVDTTWDAATKTATMYQSGFMTWSPIALGLERTRTINGVFGYWYQITCDAVWTGVASEDVLIDIVQGVPRQKRVYGMRFPAMYQGRFFRGCDVKGDQLNAFDYTSSSTIDVHNGLDSSDRGQRIYVGGSDPLTAASTIYNRFGSSIYETMLCFKHTETHLLWGTSPSDFKLYQISQSYGCPAHNTLVSAEMGYEMAEGAYRNIAMWLSYRGPVIFDGAVILPIRGVDLYFDPRKTETVINFDYIHKSFAWYDSFWMEYNLLIPTGTSTKPNVHLVYDLLRKRWYKVNYDGGVTDIPQMAMMVRDANGTEYPYVMRDDGHLLRYGFGTDWAGNDLVHKVTTADLLPSGSIWHNTKVMMIKFAHEVPDFDLTSETITVSINYYRDGTDNAEALDDWSVSVADETVTLKLQAEDGSYLLTEDGDFIEYDALRNHRYIRKTQGINKVGFTHRFQFSRTSTSTGYSGNFGKNFLWWGLLAEVEGYDIKNIKE